MIELKSGTATLNLLPSSAGYGGVLACRDPQAPGGKVTFGVQIDGTQAQVSRLTRQGDLWVANAALYTLETQIMALSAPEPLPFGLDFLFPESPLDAGQFCLRVELPGHAHVFRWVFSALRQTSRLIGPDILVEGGGQLVAAALARETDYEYVLADGRTLSRHSPLYTALASTAQEHPHLAHSTLAEYLAQAQALYQQSVLTQNPPASRSA